MATAPIAAPTVHRIAASRLQISPTTRLPQARGCNATVTVGHKQRIGGRTALPLLLPQAHTRRVAVGELNAGLLEHAQDRWEIVAVGDAAAFLEIDDPVARNHRPVGPPRFRSCSIDAIMWQCISSRK